MKIIYMGTPDFAVPPLRRLIDGGFDIPLIVTQPDRPKDRGKKILPPPVKELASEYGIPVNQPKNKEEFSQTIVLIRDLKPDIVVVAAYGRLLPADLLRIPAMGCINIHASLLPKYRGAAPIQRSILSGDRETGVTLMQMSAGMDEGDIISQKSTPIGKKTSGQLFEELAVLGGDLLTETLPSIIDGSASRIRQDHERATYAAKITKEDAFLDFNDEAVSLERRVRAMSPKPGAYTLINGNAMKIFYAEATEGSRHYAPGTIKSVDENGIMVATGGGDLLIKKIRMPGKQTMDISEYIKGNKIEIGTVLG